MMDLSQAELFAQAISRKQGYSKPEFIGEGTFKVAFKAENDQGTRYAIKVYRVATLDERAVREIRAMQRCDHPNIAKFLEFGDIDAQGANAYFLIEPFVEGGELRQAMDQGTLPRLQILGIGRALISALQHMQELALVHRDIKSLFGKCVD